jgi:hypothetical protein
MTAMTAKEIECVRRLEALASERYKLFVRLHAAPSSEGEYVLFSGGDFAASATGEAELEALTSAAEIRYLDHATRAVS